jgi:effector-binding domain-containing protein
LPHRVGPSPSSQRPPAASFDPPIVRSELPAGNIATTVRRGPYELLSQSHRALIHWISESGLTPAGPRWEVYGHWHEDPEQLETDISYLVA